MSVCRRSLKKNSNAYEMSAYFLRKSEIHILCIGIRVYRLDIILLIIHMGKILVLKKKEGKK